MRLVRVFAVAAAATLAACEQHPTHSLASPVLSQQSEVDLGSAHGSGSYSINGLIVDYSFNAVIEANGKGDGEFRVFADEGGGLTVDFTAKVTCLAVDPVNRRAWIGGRVNANASTDPDLRTKIHRPGYDIWFRVLDAATGDRSTFVGFEGAAGFITSQDYCAGQPWPADNARTWPVVTGGLTITP